MTRPAIGEAVEVAPGLIRVLAPNPGPMTHWGTNSFLHGEAEVVVIDPGPDDPGHLSALQAAAPGPITTILVTHPHLDHSPGARTLAEVTGARVLGYGPAASGLSDRMTALAKHAIGGGEGVDNGFSPDARLAEGDRLDGADWSLRVLETPGHFAGHLSFASDDWILSGDHAMAWASTLISPPHGDLGAFMATSARLIAEAPKRLFPGHGPTLTDPVARLEWLMAHRRDREAAILAALGSTPRDLSAITARVYTDIPPQMLPAAARNVLAHLIDLVDRNLVEADVEFSPQAGYRRR